MMVPKVSVIIPIYNVRRYLGRCLDALLDQTLSEMEIVCVDDGSTDGSGDIADEYAVKDSRVKVVHQVNAGAGAARNAGLEQSRGEYVFFFDPDDSCSCRMLERMYAKARKTDADIVVAGKMTVDAESGRIVAKYGFHRDIWSLPQPFSGADAADYIFTFAKSVPWDKLFRRSFIFENNLRFQNTRRCNDVYFVDMALALAKRISLCAQAYYRYSLNRADSLQSNKDKHPFAFIEAYTALERGLRERNVFDCFGAGFARVFWRTALFNMQVFREMKNILTCHAAVREILLRLRKDGVDLSGDVLLPMRACSLYQLILEEPLAEVFVASLRSVRRCDDPENDELTDNSVRKNKRLLLRRLVRRYLPIPIREMVKIIRMRFLGKKTVVSRGRRSYCRNAKKCGLLRLDFLCLNKKELNLEFSYFVGMGEYPSALPGSAFLVAHSHDGCRMLDLIPGSECSMRESGSSSCKIVGRRFACRIPLPEDGKVSLSWGFPGEDELFSWTFVEFGLYAPLTSRRKTSFFRENGWIVRRAEQELIIERDRLKARMACRRRQMFEAIANPSLAAAKACMLSVLASLARCLSRRGIWLFIDRPDRADDNACALFEYAKRLPKTKKSPCCVFAISRNSPDFCRLRKIGLCVDIGGLWYKILYLASDAVISAYRTPAQRRPFSKKTADFLRCFFARRYRFFYLRHGVSQCSQSNEIGRSHLNARILFSSATLEFEETKNAAYGYCDRNLKLCGMARYDKLYDEKKKMIVFMPTWRSYLSAGAGSNELLEPEKFVASSFCVNYKEVLGDEAFVKACERYGYKICAMLHPNMRVALPLLGMAPSVEIASSDVSYRDMFASANLVVTDYSSIAFDVAYLKKPVLYYQFDRGDFLSKQYEAGYFDWDRDGFGEVEFIANALKERVLEYLESGCRMKPKYVERVEKFFAFTDKNNCKRVYEAILDAAREDALQ